MKKRLLIYLVLTVISLPGIKVVRGAEPGEEERLIGVLQSQATLTEKDEACARLKFIGTSRSVPALAALLTDQQLSHSARYALEPMQNAEAGAALLRALDATKGEIQIGMIDSLSVRRESKAVPALARLLTAGEVATARAAAMGLGQIGGAPATKALSKSLHRTTGEVHQAVVDGLLRCAHRMLDDRERAQALAIFEQLDSPAESDGVRVAAFNGRVRASGKAALGLVVRAITGPAGPSQLAALQLVHDFDMPAATQALTALLPGLRPDIQVALIGGLAQRGDPAAVPPLVKLASEGKPEVRLAIAQALDLLGDSSVVELLAGLAASGPVELQKAARQALADLHRGDVTQALVEQLSMASIPVQAEVALALGARGDTAAVPRLLALANHGPDSARRGSLKALSQLVDNSQLEALVKLVENAKSDQDRAQAAEAVNSACQRLQTLKGHVDTAALARVISQGPPEARIALFPVCGNLIDPDLRAGLRQELNDSDQKTRAAAVEAVCEAVDPEFVPDLLELARSSKEDSVRARAIGGAVRLLTPDDASRIDNSKRAATLGSLWGLATQVEEKRKVLAGLAEVPDIAALGVVNTALDDASVGNEAARAAVKIASTLAGNPRETCEAALNKALAKANDEGTREAVRSALDELQANGDYLTDWQVSGPYQENGKDYSALFDMAFAPETKPAGAQWQPLRPGSDPKRPWILDLLKALGGDQRVAYARTWLHSNQAGDALLEIGSDDGVKVWMNDRQVYAANVARPLQPGSDKVKVSLRPGWNRLLLKVTQNNQGWEFCVRVRKPDGSHLVGLRCEADPKLSSTSQ